MSAFTSQNIALQVLPAMLRNAPRLCALLKALCEPLRYIDTQLADYFNERRYRLCHTGQVFSIENVLNDMFDSGERRIYLTDGDNLTDNLMPYDTQGFLANYSLNIPYDGDVQPQLSLKHTYTNECDFIVHVPEELEDSEEAMKAVIDEYRIAGKRYKIVFENL